ncbi:DUF695 domain-containing protein [Actinoplanes sp. NPDC024001]|uniref:DUF695 domain-containing protein n=1 Tax=Actinoplanes sp. NPDC024001 TaxID=3154598 RepID=UPI003411C9BD
MIFRRRRKPDPAVAIEAFWSWWAAGGRMRAEKQISGGPDDRLIEEIGTLVSAIHPELHWEFAAGTASRHLLVISAGGDAELRSVAERWRRAGPAPDETFGYASARQGNPGALDGSRLSIAGHQLALGDLRFSAEVDQEQDCVHVEVWHPAFPGMPQEARDQIAFLSLDWLLGEDAVEIWVGAISAATVPGAGLTGRDLVALVTGLAPADGSFHWRALSGTRDGRPLLALVQSPLRPACHPGHDLHVQLDVPYRGRDDNGLPADDVLPRLHALEDHFGRYADGAVVVAHETCDGVRTTHLYADRPAIAEALKPLVASWPGGRVRITVTPDPAWERVSHLSPR